MSHTFWIGDDLHVPSLRARRDGLAFATTTKAGNDIIEALGRDPREGPGYILAPIAAGRLLKFDFAPDTLPYAADVLRITKIAGRGPDALLRWL